MNVSFEDKEGNNDYNMECSLYINPTRLFVMVSHGDGTGDSYSINIARHSQTLRDFASKLLATIDANAEPIGYDGFTTNFAYASAEDDKYSTSGVVIDF